MERQERFDVVFMKEINEFLDSLPAQVRNKIVYNVRKVERGLGNSEVFKKLDGGLDLWEFRTLYEGNQYRLLAFWDIYRKRLVVATHGFVKKTWRVPAKEIERAEALRKKYYETEL